MENKEKLTPDLVAKAEQIINDKFRKDYPHKNAIKYSVVGVPLNVCMVIGCLFLSVVVFR